MRTFCSRSLAWQSKLDKVSHKKSCELDNEQRVHVLELFDGHHDLVDCTLFAVLSSKTGTACPASMADIVMCCRILGTCMGARVR